MNLHDIREAILYDTERVAEQVELGEIILPTDLEEFLWETLDRKMLK